MLAQTPPMPAPGQWENLTALAAVLGTFIYLVVWAFPKLLLELKNQGEEFAKEQKAAQEIFTSALKVQRDDFRAELQQLGDRFDHQMTEHRKQSHELASGGHRAVEKLADEVAKLKGNQ